MDAVNYLKEASKEVDEAIRSYIPDENPMRLIEASRQYPYAGGKRMRPAMVLAACSAVGGDRKKAIPMAVAIEYIHNFTLIHDDYMDGDEKRRNMPTLHVAYDMPTAILAGDALFAKAFQIMAELDIDGERLRDVYRYVTKAVWDLARGQQMDVDNEGQLVAEDYYIETIRLKTSVLFAAAAAGGAIVGGADKKTVEMVHGYAMALGLGFQIFDDYLGVCGDPAKTGKSAGNDIRKGKCTILVTHAMAHIKDEATKQKFISILGKADATEDEIECARNILRDAGSIDYALDVAHRKVDEAISLIKDLPESRDKEFMIALAQYSVNRDV